MVILNRGILASLIKEEEDTAKRYAVLAEQYDIPELLKASHDEANHAKMFRRLFENWHRG